MSNLPLIDHDTVGPYVRVDTIELPGFYDERYEVMIFGGKYDQWQLRCDDVETARLEHVAVVRWLRGQGAMPEGLSE